LGVLTSGSSSFQFCSCLADGPRGPSGWSASTVFFACSSCSCSASLSIRFVLGFRCSRFADGPSFSSGQSGTRTDGPPGLRGRSVFLGSVLVVLLSLTDGSWLPAGRSACLLRTVRGTWPDCPRGLCGQSAPPGWTVRPRLTALFLGSIPFPSFVLPRVLQGIVPKT
jgi:hypothetical protein